MAVRTPRVQVGVTTEPMFGGEFVTLIVTEGADGDAAPRTTAVQMSNDYAIELGRKLIANAEALHEKIVKGGGR